MITLNAPTALSIPLIAVAWDDVRNSAAFLVASTRSSATQATSGTTGVTCNGSTGIITTFAVSAAAINFVLTNSYYTSSSQVISAIVVSPSTTIGPGGPALVTLSGLNAASNQFRVTLTAFTGATVLSVLTGTYQIMFSIN
jgi:hypothetical protein